MIKRLLLLGALLLAACSQSLYNQGSKMRESGQFDKAIDAFYQEINTNPQNADAWRELGVTYYERGDLAKAEDALKQANAIRPDARANLYMGLLYEKQDMYSKAIEAYSTSLSLDPRGQTRSVIRAHLDGLIVKEMETEVSSALANEAAIKVDTISPNTIAVVDFDGSHLAPELAPLARGLAEFTAIDLAKVNSLRVIDRLKIDVILKELKLSASSAVNQATAPRLGKLLGSRRLVTGSVLDIGDDGIRIDGALVNTADSSAHRTKPAEGALNDLFKVQKDLVFSVIDSMGITLTPEERDAIAKVPTESYLAFLAYCRGLDYRQRGFLRDAQASFDQAVREDANFGEADIQRQDVTTILDGGPVVSFDGFESTVLSKAEPPQAALGLDSRLTTMELNMGVIPNLGLRRIVILPPVVRGSSVIIIRGDLDAGGVVNAY